MIQIGRQSHSSSIISTGRRRHRGRDQLLLLFASIVFICNIHCTSCETNFMGKEEGREFGGVDNNNENGQMNISNKLRHLRVDQTNDGEKSKFQVFTSINNFPTAKHQGLRRMMTEQDSDTRRSLWNLPDMPPPSNMDYADMSQNNKVQITVPTDNPPQKQIPLSVLNDGHAQSHNNDVMESIFFDVENSPNRIQMDLGSIQSIKSINTYSWHVNSRAKQVYDLYYSPSDEAPQSNSQVHSSELVNKGWVHIATVRTMHDINDENQVGVSIRNEGNTVFVDARHLLWDVHMPYTFYGEFDVYTNEVDVGSDVQQPRQALEQKQQQQGKVVEKGDNLLEPVCCI